MMAGRVSVRAYDRTRSGRPEHVGAYTRAVPDLANEGGGFGRFGSAGPPPRGGGSFIFIARRRNPLEGFGQREMPLEGGGGFAGPGRSFGNAASRAPSPRRSAEPRFDIHMDKQRRHLLGTQEDPGRSTLTADPHELMREFAGKGRVIVGSRPGVGGTRESFDAGSRVIGIFRDMNGREAPTTRGTIHYSSRGAHIVPAEPKGWRE